MSGPNDDGILEVVLLGAGAAHPTALRDTTALAVAGPSGWTLVDCPGSVVHKLAAVGIDATAIRRVVLTHDHVDHVYGLPHLLHALKMAGTERSLPVHAPEATLTTIGELVTALGLDRPGDPALEPVPVPLRGGHEVAVGEIWITSCPARHGRDAVSYRFQRGERAVCHSGDTGPNEALAELARDARILFHDCAGLHDHRDRFPRTHSSALEAGRTASAAGVDELVLVHLDRTGESRQRQLVEEAESVFAGRVSAGIDGERYRLGEGTGDRRSG